MRGDRILSLRRSDELPGRGYSSELFEAEQAE